MNQQDTTQTRPSQPPVPPVQPPKDEAQWERTSGQGAASALARLRQVERRRAHCPPGQEKPRS